MNQWLISAGWEDEALCCPGVVLEFKYLFSSSLVKPDFVPLQRWELCQSSSPVSFIAWILIVDPMEINWYNKGVQWTFQLQGYLMNIHLWSIWSEIMMSFMAEWKNKKAYNEPSKQGISDVALTN